MANTGRGLMATQTFMAKSSLISLPEKCLLTSSTVLKSYLGHFIKRWHPPISPLLALCCFLICERYRGAASEWSPYINILPKTYTCPVYFSDDIIDLLPLSLQKKAKEQKEGFQELFYSFFTFFHSLQPLFSQPTEELFTKDAFRWAWCSVNTRTVYMEHEQSKYLSMEKDIYALAPYLDLLNHCPNVQVKASFNKQTQCYEVQSLQGCKKFQQALINYGPHDNHRLLLEYGFVAPGNPHSVVYVDPATFSKGTHKPVRFCSTSWKSVLLGAAVSQDGEYWCITLALKLCKTISGANVKALERLSELKESADLFLLEQLGVVESLRKEERSILGHAQVILEKLL
ncbi:hypothetical protein DNTS_034806 [Danionella cerebrum]|uniref:SET domain-containing protein n=1 Tax=Danionella cerebrum TaxID=2873325 RepID=A0A553NRP4_9TELE|nr:hypothetical protein DNTS_034806 [Danionella translucida]